MATQLKSLGEWDQYDDESYRELFGNHIAQSDSSAEVLIGEYTGMGPYGISSVLDARFVVCSKGVAVHVEALDENGVPVDHCEFFETEGAFKAAMLADVLFAIIREFSGCSFASDALIRLVAAVNL